MTTFHAETINETLWHALAEIAQIALLARDRDLASYQRTRDALRRIYIRAESALAQTEPR